MSAATTPEKLIRKSEDGIDYPVLKTPGTTVIPTESYSGSMSDSAGFHFHHLFVKCDVIKNMGLPLDANPREPTRAKVVSEMESTLRDNPDHFHHWNNGITIICDGFEYVGDAANVQFQEGSGICNGGHTYFAIVTYPQALPDTACVHVEVIQIPTTLSPEDRRHAINDIARNRNANRQLLPTTQADYLGFYEPFKTSLGEKKTRVIWHEGDSNADEDAINSELLIRLAACVDPFWYSHPIHSQGKPNHKACATGSRSIHNKWFDGQNDHECNLRHMAPLLPELFRTLEIVAHSLKNDDLTAVGGRWRGTNFYRYWLGEREYRLKDYKQGEAGVLLPNPAAIMLLGSFRSNVWVGLDDNGHPAYVGLLLESEDLWSDGKVELLKRLTNLFEDSGQELNQFIKSNAPYENQLISIVYGQRPPTYPNWFYSLSDGHRYESVSDDATHRMECDEEGFCSLDENIEQEGGAKYRRV